MGGSGGQPVAGGQRSHAHIERDACRLSGHGRLSRLLRTTSGLTRLAVDVYEVKELGPVLGAGLDRGKVATVRKRASHRVELGLGIGGRQGT